MRRLVILLAAIFLAGCAGGAGNDYEQYYRAVRQSLAGDFHASRITRSQVAAIPYATLGYRVNGGAEQMLILATDSNGDQLWTAGSHVVLLTRNGRVIRSVGLPHDIAALTPVSAGAIPPPVAAVSQRFESTRVADFPDMSAFGVRINCTTELAGTQTIAIIGRAIATRRIDESCTSPGLKWSFVDSYWVDDQTGLVWRSVQHIHPKGGELDTEILRPAG